VDGELQLKRLGVNSHSKRPQTLASFSNLLLATSPAGLAARPGVMETKVTIPPFADTGQGMFCCSIVAKERPPRPRLRCTASLMRDPLANTLHACGDHSGVNLNSWMITSAILIMALSIPAG